MKRCGFTLVELLVVIAIMGLLGTAAVGGYRQMQRGMEERGVIQNVNKFVKAAYERAHVDRQPTAVYFWNECIREQTEDANEIVVGKAVAVRRYGRITMVDGNFLCDEFGDLNLAYPDDKVDGDDESASSGQYSTKRLYQLDSVDSGLKYSTVRDQVALRKRTEYYLTHDPKTDTEGAGGSDDKDKEIGMIKIYSFVKEDGGTADWKVGSAYGFEFASIELPHGFIFGSGYSQDVDSPVTEGPTLIFTPNGITGVSQVEVYALRPNNSGMLTAEKIGISEKPDKKDVN